MRRTILIPALIPMGLAALGALALGGCSALENLGGAKKVSPDEFKIVSHSPLTMPPNAELRPPRPGEPRPHAGRPNVEFPTVRRPSHLDGRACAAATLGRIEALRVPAGQPGWNTCSAGSRSPA